MDIYIVIQKLLMLIIVMSIGYIARKRNVLTTEYNKAFSVLIVNITMPCLIINSMLSSKAQVSQAQIAQIIIIGAIIYGSLTIISIIIPKIFKADKLQDGVYRFLTIFNNNMFMGFPIIQSVLGDDVLFYSAILNIPSSIFMFSVGIYLMSKHQKTGKLSIKKMLNPGIISALVCTILYFIGYSMPPVVAEACKQVGAITIPLSMIVLGISLADMPVKSIIKDIKIYVFSVLKMVLIPMVLFYILSPIVSEINILYVIIITLAMPGPTLCVSIANEYGADTNLASKYVFISTILSLITIPVVINMII